MLGLPDTLQISSPTQTRLWRSPGDDTGNHQLGLYAWTMVSGGLPDVFEGTIRPHARRLLQHAEPTVGGLLGARINEGHGDGRCNWRCRITTSTPSGRGWERHSRSIPKRASGRRRRDVRPFANPAGASYSAADYYSFNSLGYGNSPVPNGLTGGNPYPTSNGLISAPANSLL